MYEPDTNDSFEILELKEYYDNELQKIANSLLVGETDSLECKRWTEYPPRPYEGVIAYLTTEISTIYEDGLYEYKDERWIGLSGQCVWDSGVLTSAVSSIYADLQHLKLTSGDQLRLVIDILDSHTANIDYYITPNVEAASPGFRQVAFYNDGGGNCHASRYAAPVYGWGLPSSSFTGEGFIFITEANAFTWRSSTHGYNGTAGIISAAQFHGFRDNVMTVPLDGITFSASAGSNQYGIGSRLRLYRS